MIRLLDSVTKKTTLEKQLKDKGVEELRKKVKSKKGSRFNKIFGS